MEKRVRIAFFDSGVGGFSVLRACMRRLAAEYDYYGDLIHAPFGSRSAEEIEGYTAAALRLFEERGADAAVLACNTATSVCVEKMRAAFSFPIIGVEPAVSLARGYARVLVLVTPRTAESARLARLIARFPQTHYLVCPLPRLATAVESYFAGRAPLDLSDLQGLPPADAAVLGCTHYSLVAEEIASFLRMPVLDGAEGTADHLVKKLGTDDHQKATFVHPNFSASKLTFVGECGKLMEEAYKTNICFQYFQKKLP